MSLTKMKRAFIAAYCENPKLGQAEAARSAGCSVKRAKVTAYEWMRDPEVKLEIQRQLTTKLDRVEGQIVRHGEVTRESVFRLLEEVEELCKAAGAGAWQTAGLLKVVEFRGKALKLWVERVEFGADEKLIALLEAGRKRAAGLSVPIAQLPTPNSAEPTQTAAAVATSKARPKKQSKSKRASAKRKRIS